MRLRTIAAVAAACGLLGLAGAGSAQDKGGAKPAGKPALTVTTITPQRIDMALNVQATGSLAAWQEAIIGAESGGLRVAEVRVNVGDTVTRGHLKQVASSALGHRLRREPLDEAGSASRVARVVEETLP